MNKLWSENAWNEYIAWESEDRKTLKHINALIKDIERSGPFDGIGKPEPLKGEFSGLRSRRIGSANRVDSSIKLQSLMVNKSSSFTPAKPIMAIIRLAK